MNLRSPHIVLALLLSAAAGAAACAHPPRPNTPVRIPLIQATLAPTDVPDARFPTAAHELLVDGQSSPQRLALLAGVVRRQFSRAVQRFDGNEPVRGLQAVRGALYLVRAGELRSEMFGPDAARALDHAYSIAAQSGEEGPSLAFLHLRSAALPPGHPDQTRIAARLRALADWMRDTRRKSNVENASADAVAFADQSMLEPTTDSLEQARSMAERWISASLDFQSTATPGPRADHDQMLEAYRGTRTGAMSVAGLYLRHGDAEGALRALDTQTMRRITPPTFFTVLQAAVSSPDPAPWQDLASVYMKAADNDEAEITVPPGIARGAAWGTLLEAYRRDPQSYDVARTMAGVLPQLGMPDVSPLVLLAGVQAGKDPRTLTDAMRLVLTVMAQEDAAQDAPSAARVYEAAQPLLAHADSVRGSMLVEPSTAKIRAFMGSIYVRAADPAAAKPVLEQAAAAEPSLQTFAMLAAVRFQAGDPQGALDAVTRAVAAPDARESPLGVADAWLIAFQVHRSRADVEHAREALAAALRVTLDATTRASTDTTRASCERMLARLAWFYGDRDAWSRAIQRMTQYAAADQRAQSMALIETASAALLWGDGRPAREALLRTAAGDVEDEDLVYAALWLQLTERKQGIRESDIVRNALTSISTNESWPSALAAWGLGKIDDKGLLARARNVSQRTEASFYAAMRRRSNGDTSADADLVRIANGPAIELVETHLSRELTTSSAPRPWGQPPVQLP